ncbi:hypothetical protein [Psychromonas sp. SP041]|uniref:hypothetical protein n=1 Tax=Psychromonas sp. SP041 TaxID=1365007 RepID=UPI00046EA457|nr:hypothetical protein [Psychromonas sp. SP041]
MIVGKIEERLEKLECSDKDLCKIAMDLMIYIDSLLGFQYIKSKSFDDPVFMEYANTSHYDEVEANLDSGVIRQGIVQILSSRSGNVRFKLKVLQILTHVARETSIGNDTRLIRDVEFNIFNMMVNKSVSDFNLFLEEKNNVD